VLDVSESHQFAVLLLPVVLFFNAQLPTAVLVIMLPLPRPMVSPLMVASAVVSRLPDAPARRNPSMLFLLNTRSLLSVVPMN
jgi:hypothetical protein